MKINYIVHSRKDIKDGLVEVKKGYKIDNPCPCGCSPRPFVLLKDGMNHLMSIEFESQKEIVAFRRGLAKLRFPKRK